jgi:hypothetical protein
MFLLSSSSSTAGIYPMSVFRVGSPGFYQHHVDFFQHQSEKVFIWRQFDFFKGHIKWMV